MTMRKALYPGWIADGTMDQATANHRFLCLSTACYILGNGNKPTVIKPLDDVLHELSTWKRTIQRESTPATARGDGQRIGHIEAFIKHYSPMPADQLATQKELF